jgi:hypothetical protein
MITKNTVLRVAALCLLSGGAPAWAGGPATCIQSISTPRLVCDEGACVRVSVKRRALKPSRIEADPVRDELTLLIASVS